MRILNLKAFFISLALTLLSSQPVRADENALCAPFKNSMIDESIMAEMLSAAKDGHLYRIQSASSRVGFCVDSPIGEVRGEFKTFEGGLTMQPRKAAEKGRVMVIVDTSSLETSGAFIESLLKSESFFDVENYPEIMFVSTGFEWVSKTEAVLIGELTMHGITKKVGFHVQLIESDEKNSEGAQKIIVKASTSILRSEFGIFTMSKLVSDAVNLCMSVDAVKVKS
jgi:polyisoprenoid-binding protein YceI